MVWLLRFILLFLVIFFFYLLLKNFLESHRKLESARKQKRFLLIDYEDVRRNFLLTHKGAVFIGEKYIGTSGNSFDVVSITVWPQNSALLIGMAKEDFEFIEKKIHEKYSQAEIHWKSPVQEILRNK